MTIRKLEVNHETYKNVQAGCWQKPVWIANYGLHNIKGISCEMSRLDSELQVKYYVNGEKVSALEQEKFIENYIAHIEKITEDIQQSLTVLRTFLGTHA